MPSKVSCQLVPYEAIEKLVVLLNKEIDAGNFARYSLEPITAVFYMSYLKDKGYEFLNAPSEVRGCMDVYTGVDAPSPASALHMN